MLKNLLVSLPTVADDHAATAAYAVSLGREFNAHLAAVAFAYQTVPIGIMGDHILPELLDDLQEEAETLAKGAVAKFDAATRGSGISAEARWMPASFAGAGDLFGQIALRF